MQSKTTYLNSTDGEINLCPLFLSLLHQVLPCAFEHLRSILLPSPQSSIRDSQTTCKFFLRHISGLTHFPDLLPLTVIKKQVIFIKQFCNRNRKQFCYFKHLFNRIIVTYKFLIARICAAVNSSIIRNIPLAQSASVAIPPKPIWNVIDF